MDIYANRIDAGRRLGETLRELAWPVPPLVLGVPRGGVVVAAEVAAVLGASLGVAVAGKVGAPHNPELAIGAVAEGGTVIYDQPLVEILQVSRRYLQEETGRVRAKIARRVREFRGGRGLDVAGRETVLVDDGVATGLTLEALAKDLAGQGPVRLVLAVPVGPAETLERLGRVADLIVCPLVPVVFGAVGAFFADFRQVEEEEVQRLLARHGTQIL